MKDKKRAGIIPTLFSFLKHHYPKLSLFNKNIFYPENITAPYQRNGN